MQSVSSWAPKLARSVRVNIGYPVVRTDGRWTVGVRSVYGHAITKFSGMGKWVNLLSYGAPPTSALRARVELRYNFLGFNCNLLNECKIKQYV